MKRLFLLVTIFSTFLTSSAFAWDIVQSVHVYDNDPYDAYYPISVNVTNDYHIQIHGDPGVLVKVRVKRSDSVILFEETIETTLNLLVLNDFNVETDCWCQLDLERIEPGEWGSTVHADLMKQER